MITTSRGRVSAENHDEVGVLTRPSMFNNNTISENQTMGIDTEQEYNTESIALKLFGSLENLPQEYQEAKDEDVRLAPTNKTMAVANEKQISKVELFTPIANAKVKSNAAVSTQAKIAVSAFAIVVLALSLAIIFTALSVSTAFAGIGTLSTEYVAQTEVASQLAEQLAQVDEAQLLERAMALGYTLPTAETSQVYTVPELRAPQTYQVEQGWFDKMCDFLSNILR